MRKIRTISKRVDLYEGFKDSRGRGLSEILKDFKELKVWQKSNKHYLQP